MPGICPRCSRTVYFAEQRVALGRVWHVFCFSCYCCRKLLDSCSVAPNNNELYCVVCYGRLFGRRPFDQPPSCPPCTPCCCSECDTDPCRCPEDNVQNNYDGSSSSDTRSGYSSIRTSRRPGSGKSDRFSRRSDSPSGGCWSSENVHSPRRRSSDRESVATRETTAYYNRHHKTPSCWNDNASCGFPTCPNPKPKHPSPSLICKSRACCPCEIPGTWNPCRKVNQSSCRNPGPSCTAEKHRSPCPVRVDSKPCKPPSSECCHNSGIRSPSRCRVKGRSLGGGSQCKRCNRPVYPAEQILAAGGFYHNCCFSCLCCRQTLEIRSFLEGNGEIYCKQCYIKVFGPSGYGYGIGATLQSP